MLTIRLQRVGRTNDPSFRVILTDSKRAARTGGFVEILGNYDARKGSPHLQTERIKYWLSVGAKTSGTVHNLLLSEKIIEGKKINVLPKKSPPKKEVVKEKETTTDSSSILPEAPEEEQHASPPAKGEMSEGQRGSELEEVSEKSTESAPA
ncbi:30S ribosomal protein S16 [bacterium]|nr:30S ribosomal protein S16 [bacterium]